jgi:heme/copper-type cytochrome/quinol oxidase subunit 4
MKFFFWEHLFSCKNISFFLLTIFQFKVQIALYSIPTISNTSYQNERLSVNNKKIFQVGFILSQFVQELLKFIKLRNWNKETLNYMHKIFTDCVRPVYMKVGRVFCFLPPWDTKNKRVSPSARVTFM